MKSKMIATALSLLALLWIATPLAQEPDTGAQAETPRKSTGRFPKDVPGLQDMAQQAIADGNGLRLLQTTILLRRQQPYVPEHFVNMVRAYAMMEKPTSAYHYMLKMQQQGLTYDFDQHQETAALGGTEVYDYLNDLLIRAGEPAGEAEPAFGIGPEFPLPTAITWDPNRERFLVGTAGSGAVLAVSEDGSVTRLLEANDDNGMWAIMDLEVDPARNLLWVSSAAIPQFEGLSNDNAGKSGLFEFQLDTLEVLGRYIVESDDGPHELGAIALDTNGDVYVADRKSATLYRRKLGLDHISPFVADKELNGFSDIAISADSSRVYLADWDKGVLVIDPENEKAAMLGGPETLNLGGIEAIFHAGSELIIIQSGIKPQRVVALKLDASGGTVEEVRPMAIALEWFERPSRGTIRDDSIYYLADSGLDAADAPGSAVMVLRTALDAGNTIVAPDMRKFEDETISRVREHDRQNQN